MPDNTISLLNERLSHLLTLATNLRDMQKVLQERLIGKGEAGPMSKIENVEVRDLHILLNPANQVLGCYAVTGSGHYRTAITLHPKTAHKCTCPDWDMKRRACKHVLATADKCDDAMGKQVTEITESLRKARESLRALAEDLDLTLVTAVDHLSKP